MKQRYFLVAVLSILILAATSTLAMAEEDSAHLSGNWEVGVTGVDLEDNPARVNEYGTNRTDKDGVNLATEVNLEYINKGFMMELESDINGADDQQHALELDFNRIFKFDFETSKFNHWKDQDTLEHLGATMSGDIDGDQPRIFTNQTWAKGDKEQFAWEQSQDYFVTRKESEAGAELQLPALPNITFHAGVRIEEREGMEQSIALSKCSACHVEANPKEIDELTEEFTLGATGKFGLLTVEYEYLSRDFEERADLPTYTYWDSGKIRFGSTDRDQVLYMNEELEYNKTPDSEKDSHLLSARLDLPNNTVISGSYVNADIESAKEGEEGTYEFVGSDTLTSAFESFALKGATRIGGLRLSMYGSSYEIDGPDYTLYFPDRVDNVDWDHDGVMEADNNTYDNPADYESAESRDVTEFGIDAVYRVTRGTTLRLGYEYEDVEREHEELGETETSTYKLSLHSRLAKGLNARFSYTYQDIDDPFGADHATGIAQGHEDAIVDGTLSYLLTNDYKLSAPDFVNVDDDPLAEGNTVAAYYWNTVYPARGLAATDQPDEVQELKASTTWSPAANMSVTAYIRARFEENSDVKYEENTYVPGLTFWYAPNDKMNLVMAYNFNKQETENQMCVGWYHG